MAKSDDILKKYGITQGIGSDGSPKNAAPKPTTPKATGVSKADKILAKYGINQVRRSNSGTTQNWYDESVALLSQANKYFSDWHSKDDEGYRGLQDQINSYISEGDYWYKQHSHDKDASSAIGDVLMALNRYSSMTGALRDYYGQWETAEDYSDYLDWQKGYDEKSKYDTAAGQKEIDALENELSNLKNGKANLGPYRPVDNSYLGSPYAAAQQSEPASYQAVNTTVNGRPYAAGIHAQYAQREVDPTDLRISELEKQISQKKQYLNQAKHIQEGINLSGAAQNADFKQYNGYVSTKEDDAWGKLTSQYGMGYADLTYEYINNQNGIRDEINRKHSTYSSNDDESVFEKNGYDYMNANEIAIYNYYYAKEGKEAAEKYLNNIQETLNHRKAAGIFSEMEGNTALEMVFGVEAGIDQFKSGMKNLVNFEDDYIAQTAYQIASGMVREDLADDGFKLPKFMGGASIGQVGYDVITTTANMAPSVLASTAIGLLNPTAGAAVGNALMGASAAGNAYQQALNEGFDKGQARGYSILVGASELVMEKALGGISALGGNTLGKYFTKNIANADSALKMIAKRLGAGMISEFSEEYLQEVLDPFFQNLMLGTDHDVKLISSEALYAGILGALSAGVMEGPAAVGTEVKTYGTGKQLKDAGITATRLADVGKTFAADTVAYQLAGKVDENTGAYTMGRLFNEIGAALTEQNKADITNALVAEGMNKEHAEVHAEILDHIFEGGEVSDIQMRAIEKNDILSKVIKEVLIDSNSTVNQRTKGYNDVLNALAHEMTSGTGTAAAPAENAPASDKVDTKKENGSDASPAPVGEQLKNVAESVVQSKSVGSAVFANENQRVVAENYADLASTTDNQVIVNMDEQSRNKLVAAYDPSTGMIPKVYVTGSNEAFYYGFEGIPLESMSKYSIAMSLSDKQRSFAYNLGVESAARSVDTQSSAIEAAYSKAKEVLAGKNLDKNGKVTANKNTTGRAILESGIKESSMTQQQKASYKLADTVAQAVGTNIHVYSGMTEYGKYDENTGEIWLNINANISGQSMMAFTLAHELVHMAKQWSPKKFKAFADYLLGEYGKKGVTIDALIQEQIDNAKRNGVYLDPHAAYEEVIADACQRMLLDSDAVQKMATFKEKNPGLVDKIMKTINDFISKVRAYFKGAEPDSVEAQYYKELDDAAKKILENMFVDMVMDAGEHLSTIRNAFGKGTVVEVNEDGEFTLAKGKDATGSKFLYNDYTWERGGRDTLKAALKAEGFRKEDIDAALVIMDGKHELVKDLAKQFPEQNRINQATVTTDLKDGHSVLSALVSNGDYPVNIDLLMVCKKRKAYQRVINRLCETGLIQQATVDALAIAEINKILGKYGFETACLGCFVESRRLRIQEWAETICSEWNAEVKRRNPNAKAFGFGKGEATLTPDEVMQLVGELESGGPKNEKGNLNLGQGSAVKRMGVLLDKVPSLRKTLSIEDLITPDGLTSLRSYDSNLFSMVKSRYGSNSPKFVQEFNPYNHELAQYGKVPSEYSSLREYLYAIGGARMQSFSDFIVENWFDYCQIVADLAARKLPMHTYTKEIALVRLFGLTGIKINMSLIPDIDRSLSKEYAGLTRNADGELELIWADKDRFKATGGKSYMQSINFKDAMDLQNDPRYSANVGTIAIGVSDIQIRMMLNDPRIRMVIPYHSSGMNPIFADLMGTSYYKDYTMVQNTTVKQVYDSDGKKVSLKLDKTQTGKLTSGFQFNEVLQELGDARAAADAYKKWCADASKHTITINGKTYTAELTPKFADFSGETNYYKLLEDFNTYDCISEQAAPQGDVQQIYPENFDKILTAELKAQENHRQKQVENQAFDNAMGEIESFLKNHTKADTVFYAEQHGVTLGAKDKKLNAADKKKLAELRKGTKNSLPKVNDTEYLNAVKRGDMETAQKIEGYRVNPTSMFGAVSAVVTKIGDAKYSNPKTDGMSSRQLLADAFYELVQTPEERKLMDQYRGNISKVEEVQERLKNVRGKISELSNGKGNKEKIDALNKTAADLSKLIDGYDRKLLEMEASKPLRDVLERAKSDAYQKAKRRGEKNLKKYREKVSERFDRGVAKKNIQNVVKELNDLLLNESKKRHVPDSLKKAVAGALSIVNMDTVGAEERAAKYAALIAKEQAEPEPDQDKIDSYTVSMENILRQGEKMAQRLKDLRDAYEEIQKSTDPDIANAYDPDIAGAIKELSASIGDTSLRNMSIEQLSDVYDMYKMVLTRVRDANKALVESNKENISTLASRVIGEVWATGGAHTYRIAALDPVRKFLWNNLKPVYAMEHIGSATLTKLFNNVRAGEDTWAKDVTEARKYYLDKSKKYGYNSWDFKKKYRFESNSGVPFKLTLEQILSLYAYSKRNQAHDHLRIGGFVFDSNIETYTEKGSKLLKYKVNTADAHQITPEILGDIIGKLTPEQMGFVDEMQDYLSTVMGAKGNEVTSKMYGVKLFKEKFYFPLKSAKQFMFEQNEVSGEVKIKNSGFTNKVVAKANNPVILSNFMEVWLGHVNDMSMYHAFVLPLEDFNRVFNYNSPKKDGKAPVSVKGTIQNAYSPAAVSYVKNLITDLNGGARGDNTTGFINKMMGLFKKGSVFASLSVVIQQPSAIARATALVDPKYFVGAKVDSKRHKLLWEEIKKYAPVAIIKEMGYFDTNMGKSTEDFILGKEYSGFKEKMKALVTDSDYRDEILSKAPSLADELAWCAIWNAIKREIKDKNPGIDTKPEVFLRKVGERFTEVIIKTQVYDSVLSRSANMRSKDTGMKMATAFMAELTTSINMIADALLKGKRGNKKYARAAIGAVIASQILNSILVSFVYAGRDDDEEKSYWEKYIESLTGNVLDSLNPMTYIPFVKDIMSIAQGYDVERSDMAVVSDLWKAWQNLSNDRLSVYRKVEGFAGSIAQLFGLPVKNIMRDVRGIYQTINSFMNGEQTTKAGIGYAVKAALPKWIAGGEASNQDQLYNAYVNGDKDQIARVSGRYDDESAVQSALRKGLRDNDPRVHEAAIAWNANDLDEYMRLAREIIGEKHFSQDDVVMAIRAEANSLAPDEERSTTSKAKGLFTADKFAEAIAQGDQAMANSIRSDIIQTDMKNGKTAEEAEKSFESSAKSELKELFMAGTINENRARTALVTFAGMEDEEADLQVQAYSWERQGFAGATMAAVRDYNEHCAVVGVPKGIYLYVRKFSNNTENDVDETTGKTIYYSAMKRVMDEIDSQSLTDAQKTAIARSLGWSEKNIQKYKPW